MAVASPTGKAVAIDTRGVADLVRDLRRISPELSRAMTTELRGIANTVRDAARQNAAEFSSRGAASIKSSVRRGTASIYTNLFWMRYWEEGFHPGGGTTFIEGRHALTRARDERAPFVEDQLGELLDRVARRTGGFH